jgi:uncharacterized protein YegP (UPF0339 family)
VEKVSEKFEYWESPKDGLWYFHLIAPNNEIVAQSQGYTTKENCINGIEAVKKYSNTATTEEKSEE